MKENYFFKNCFLVALIVTSIIALSWYLFDNGFSFSSETTTQEVMTGNETMDAEDLIEEISALSYDVQYVTSDKHYLDDALFIGDSRTVGLYYYGDIKNADFFCDVGMSIYNLPSTRVSVGKKGTYSLDELLTKYKYGKVYIMMGINEAGYNIDDIDKKYAELIEKIKKSNPDAIIYICANLHVTTEKSNEKTRINNANIDSVNYRQRLLVDNKRTFYINANTIFDDDTGGLNPEYTGDNIHLFASCYEDWVEFLLTKTIVKDKASDKDEKKSKDKDSE